MPEFYRVALEYPKTDDITPVEFSALPVGPERALRLDLRMLLNQHDGTFNTTNAIADDMAIRALRTLRAEGYIKTPPPPAKLWVLEEHNGNLPTERGSYIVRENGHEFSVTVS
jgi:hypothetical protein